LTAINSAITTANNSAGGPGSSVGWVGNNGWAGKPSVAPIGSLINGRLDFSGQFNGNTYPVAVPACIGSGAQWMEYNPEPTNSACNPFRWGSITDYSTIPNFLREYLIYRIGPLGPIISTNVCTNAFITIYNPNNIVATSCTPIQETYSPTVTYTTPDGSAGALTVVCNPPSGSTFYPNTTTTVQCTATVVWGFTTLFTNTCSCSFTVNVQCTNCVQAPTNMVLWLPFDETNGTISANLASPANYGTQVGGPGVVLGSYVDNSLSFNGVNQYVTVPDYPAIDIGTNDFTIDAWVYRPTGSGNSTQTIVEKRVQNGANYYGFVFDVYLDNTLLLQMADGPYTSFYQTATVPADGQWHFVAATVQRTSANGGQFYVDGVPTGGTFNPTVRKGSLSNTGPLVVGALTVSSTYWLGGLDEVEMFNRALSASEIESIFYAGRHGKCKSPCLIVNCPTNKTVQCGTAWDFDSPSASSCCGGNVSIVVVTNTTTGLCPEYFTRTWLLTDVCSNTATCSQTVTVQDTTPPVIICPTNAVVVMLNSNCQLVIPLIQVSATDNCTPARQLVYTQSPRAGTVLPLGQDNQLVTVTVTDLCTNSSHCYVEVIGMPPGPVVIWPANAIVTNCVVPCVVPQVTDPCCPAGSWKITQRPACGAAIAPGINTVTVTVTDCHGKSATKVIPLVITGSGSFLANLFDTGVSSTRAPLADDTVDPHYTLSVGNVPAGMPSDYHGNAVAVSATCHVTDSICAWYKPVCGYVYTPWDLNSPYSKWIAPDYTNNGCCPAGSYFYTLDFTLPGGFIPSTASISGRWAADDAAGMYLNGVAPANKVASTVKYNQWTGFTIPPGQITAGNNKFYFVVTNLEYFTGLRVEFTNAFANCYTCAPPSIISITTGHVVPQGGVAALSVAAAGTPPFSYQWYWNSQMLPNGGAYSGVHTANLLINPVNYANAGLYAVVISNPCGSVTGKVRLAVSPGRTWPWGWWNVAQLDAPLAASIGPALNLVASGFATNYSITAGMTEDFGLPNPGGQIVNVMHVAPLSADASIQVPLIAPAGSNSVNSYTVIMDLYEPDTSLGTPSTLFQSRGCCVGSGQDGVTLALDAQNYLHLAGFAAGVPFDAASAAPLPVDAWDRVALVVNDPQDGVGVDMALYLNGQPVTNLTVSTSTGLPINWSDSPPTLLSVEASAGSPNGEFYVSSIQFHAVAFAAQTIAGIGSVDDPIPANDTSVGPQPVLAVTASSGNVSFTWTGSPYVLQEATSLTSGVWEDSALSFNQSVVNGAVLTTAVANPATEGPTKFYRLIFRP
jgi:hypothetical protein